MNAINCLIVIFRFNRMVSFGVEDFANRYGGLKPSQFVDMIALSGDRSDNIPGYFVLLSPLFRTLFAETVKHEPN